MSFPRQAWVAVALAGLMGCLAHEPHHRLQFVDAETGRGVPLVELETMNEVRYVSDSAGRVAIWEPAWMGETLYLQARSHGYSFPADRFGFHGVRVRLTPGGTTVVPITRVNLAERLYRITGEGIYRDSQLLGDPTPPGSDVTARGGVFGQDSVVNAVYEGKLYWFWGDTERGSYPLGNFQVAGATSELPGAGGLDPDVGVDLSYFVASDGFSRPTCPIEGPGPVWISGVMVLGKPGSQQMLCHYARMRDLGTRAEHGLAKWNPKAKRFDKLVTFPLDAPLHPHGHPIARQERGARYFYFGNPFPHTRVLAEPEAIADPTRYEAFTPLAPGGRVHEGQPPPLERDADGQLVWGWKRNTPVVTPKGWREWVTAGLVNGAEGRTDLFDMETGEAVVAHGGSIAWSEHRQRWVMIALQQGGRSSLLGEVWYAEAPSLLGPWSPARRVVTHDRYTFYNVKQHPYFAQGSHIYFEGTYTVSFSGNQHPTPRYDYNQIMYRLNLDDPRLPRQQDSTHQPTPAGQAAQGSDGATQGTAEPADGTVLLVRVRDGAAFRARWRQEASLRAELGVTETNLGQALDDPSLWVVYVAHGKRGKGLLARSQALSDGQAWTVMARRPQRHHVDPGPSVRAPYAAIVRQTVQDFGRWWKVFGELESARVEAGIVAVRVSQAPDDPHEVYLHAWFTDPERYAALFRSRALRDKLASGGVVGTPEVVRVRVHRP